MARKIIVEVTKTKWKILKTFNKNFMR
jgi:hypothetical protein